MRYSFMSFSCPGLSLREMFSLARRSGYDGIEPRLGSGHQHGVEVETDSHQRAVIRQLAQENGIALCCLATSCRFADPAIARENLDLAHQAIDLAGDVGASTIRVFGGAFPETLSRFEAIQQVSSSLLTLVEHARDREVTVCLETHDAWCDPAHVAEVMKRVDDPAIGVNWDFQHPIRACGWTVDQAYTTLKPWIRHVHFHDGTLEQSFLEMKPIGEGVYHPERVVELLFADHYEGFLSGEWFEWPDYESYLPKEVSAMRLLEKKPSTRKR